MDDVVKLAGWVIIGAVSIHLLTSTQFPAGIGALFGGFSNLISAMLGNGTGGLNTATNTTQTTAATQQRSFFQQAT